MESIPGSSYGDAYAGAKDFDFVEFIRRPSTICRLINILFAIVVFGCISAAGYESNGNCIYNAQPEACHYGVAIGVLAFLACLLFLAVDVQFSSISNATTRKQLLTADLGFSGIWSFLWFVGFCYLADQWRRSHIKTTYETNHARAAIAFSFFSVFSWATMTLMAMQRYRQGDGFHYDDNPPPYPNEYQGGYTGQSNYTKSSYAPFPQPTEDSSAPTYQQPQHIPPEQPFGVPQTQPPVITEYNVPAY